MGGLAGGGGLEFRLDARLFQDRVGAKSLSRGGVHREDQVRDRAKPDLVIAVAIANKAAIMIGQYALQIAAIGIDHQAATGVVRS